MRDFTTEDVVIGVIAALGVLVLVAVFAYVVKEVIMRKD